MRNFKTLPTMLDSTASSQLIKVQEVEVAVNKKDTKILSLQIMGLGGTGKYFSFICFIGRFSRNSKILIDHLMEVRLGLVLERNPNGPVTSVRWMD
ncbi:hypothetical protein AQUCO_05100014v1 [Aquilegia coerulea]|uniref:Uncharacterized protein n=1 Tax=Aquilegia coerulea TaxID=218851 RepID=A0A2G5CIV4_AQUCA|nr:hypothetical protein AQUCO_05100014v1 [Aquilegia coerulea]